MLERNILEKLYIGERKSMQEIATLANCSLHKVSYWIKRHEISVRDHSEATYVKRNPSGDPFHFKFPKLSEDLTLFGLGIGLYWGEGNRANEGSIRLGNTDPGIISSFIKFLTKIFHIDTAKLKFSLQIFNDIDPERALDFWSKKLNIQRGRIGKPVITKSGSIGTYRKKSQYGVLTVMYHNKKLRDLLISLLPM